MSRTSNNEQLFMDQLLQDLDENDLTFNLSQSTCPSKSSPNQRKSLAGSTFPPSPKVPIATHCPGLVTNSPKTIVQQSSPKKLSGKLPSSQDLFSNNGQDDDEFFSLISSQEAFGVSNQVHSSLEQSNHGPTRTGWRLSDMSSNAIRQRKADRLVHRTYTRCIVLGLLHQNYIPSGPSSSRPRLEKVLVLQVHKPPTLDLNHGLSTTDHHQPHQHPDDQEPETVLSLLRDEWLETDVHPGDIVHLIGRFEQQSHPLPKKSEWEQETPAKPKIEIEIENTNDYRKDIPLPSSPSKAHTIDSRNEDDDLWADMCSLPSLSQCTQSSPKVRAMVFCSQQISVNEQTQPYDSRDNLLILHPDTLVPVTKVADVASCMRRPIIQDRLRGASETTVSLVMGNMLHEVLQACLTATDALSDNHLGIQSPFVGSDPHSSSSSVWPTHWSGIGDFSRSFVERQIQAQIHLNIEKLYSISLRTDEAIVSLAEKAASFARFATMFLASTDGVDFHPDATVKDDRAIHQPKLRLIRILDVEEEIWSPMFGLKGKVDVSVETELLETLQDHDHDSRATFKTKNTSSANAGSTAKGPFTRGAAPRIPFIKADKNVATTHEKVSLAVMPLELKTGRSELVSIEHRAQTMLYTLIMSDRYGCPISDGLLYYSKNGDMFRIRQSRNEIRSLIIGRNSMAGYLIHRDRQKIQDRPLLPPTIDNEHKCRRCFAVDGCMLYRRAVENVIDPLPEDVETNPDATQVTKSSRIADLYHEKTDHLSQVHLDFFKKWEHLLSIEEQDLVRYRRELWTMTARSREKVGRCFSNMRLSYGFEPPMSNHKPKSEKENLTSSSTLTEGTLGSGTKSKSMHRFTYRFIRHHNGDSNTSNTLLNGHISINDPATISIEPGLLSVAQGFVTALTSTEVEISVDHDLRPALQRAVEESGIDGGILTPGSGSRICFRIDRDELSAGMGKIRSNLAGLFWSGERGDSRRRELIVDLREPEFLNDSQVDTDALPDHLNSDQRKAIRKVLAAKDYALILGMPGTGKTTTIAELIRLLISRGNSILLTSYTHSAVDTIVRKLANFTDDGLRILRLGNRDKVHPDIQQFTSPLATTTNSMEELETMLLSPNVIATTCLSIDHVLFSKRRFDYCIVDEASQITLPTCLGPLRFADKFVLVGDHFQLPPLVRNPEAKQDGGGLELSLFKLLSDKYDQEATVYLSRQYRMNSEIMTLSNELIYSGRLSCGSTKIATQRLVLPNPLSSDCWSWQVLDPCRPVVFVNINSTESKTGSLVENPTEATIVVELIHSLLKSRINPKDIAVITPYRQQIKRIKASLYHHHPHSNNHQDQIEVITADKSQGRDKDVILVSFVRANSNAHVGQLLTDQRRLNVAFTRAKFKLILIGSRDTISRSNHPVLSKFLSTIDQRGWMLNLDHHHLVTPSNNESHQPSQTVTPCSKHNTDIKSQEPSSSSSKTSRQSSITRFFSPSSSSESIGKRSLQTNPIPSKRFRTNPSSSSSVESNPILSDLINELV